MSEPQKKAAALVAMILVAIVFVVIMALVAATLASGPLGDRFPGSFALAVAAGGGAALTALKSLPLIVSVGLSFVIPKDKADWRFIATVVMALIGMVAALFLYFQFAQAGQAHRLWSYSEVIGMDSPKAISDVFRPALLVLAGWFLGILAVQLGVNFVGGPPDGN